MAKNGMCVRAAPVRLGRCGGDQDPPGRAPWPPCGGHAGGAGVCGWQAWRLLWGASRLVSAGVAAWVVASAVISPLVVASLGFVVGAVPAAVLQGMDSTAGQRLLELLAVAAVVYAASLVCDPIGGALGTAAARIIALLVLLGSVSPRLLLLPVTAVPPLLADRVAKRITKASEDAMAAARRLAGMLFQLACDAERAGELRSYGLSGVIARRHAALTAALDRRARTEALKVLAVQSAGWLLYAAGLMAAIGFTVIRASDGSLSLGTVLMTVSLIRRSRAQLASAASGSGALIQTLATVDRVSSVGVGEVATHSSEPLALAALDRAGAADLAGQLPGGLSTYVGGPDGRSGEVRRALHPAGPGIRVTPSTRSSLRAAGKYQCPPGLINIS